jgi:dUTP pyrophosphatase
MDDLLTVLDSPDLLPTRAHAGDAGADLRAAEDAILYPGEVKVIRTGVRMCIPCGYAGFVRGRSGMTRSGIIVLDGTVDGLYRGEIGVMMVSFKDGPALIRRGDRIAQLVIVPVGLPSFMAVDSLPGSERGEAGFGSTGK